MSIALFVFINRTRNRNRNRLKMLPLDDIVLAMWSKRLQE
jgi:hypothetical protein